MAPPAERSVTVPVVLLLVRPLVPPAALTLPPAVALSETFSVELMAISPLAEVNCTAPPRPPYVVPAPFAPVLALSGA